MRMKDFNTPVWKGLEVFPLAENAGRGRRSILSRQSSSISPSIVYNDVSSESEMNIVVENQ